MAILSDALRGLVSWVGSGAGRLTATTEANHRGPGRADLESGGPAWCRTLPLERAAAGDGF